MGQKVTIGGNRLGSGPKMKAELHNYFRSTHNLSQWFKSSMGVGILYPCLCIPAVRGDVFDIDINSDIRTIPAKGALFGSFKLQIDVFQCPVRLYQALLHNNPLAIGLNMSQVKLPKLQIRTRAREDNNDYEAAKFANNSLLKYLGMSGIGTQGSAPSPSRLFGRRISAIPALAYYDIYKNYYANKQEENGVIITPKNVEERDAIKRIYGGSYNEDYELDFNPYTEQLFTVTKWGFTIVVQNDKNYRESDYESSISIENNTGTVSNTLADLLASGDILSIQTNTHYEDGKKYDHVLIIPNITNFDNTYTNNVTDGIKVTTSLSTLSYKSNISLTTFELSNIDDMRYDILSHHTLGSSFVIGTGAGEEGNYMPYRALVDQEPESGYSANYFPMNGLAIKTYQNDIYNNWLNTEWIEGANGINELSKVQIGTDGAFSMDELSFAHKLYDMLNRIAIAGATYEDWQDVVYQKEKRRQIESPIFCGGFSSEIVFDEIVQSAPANGDPLGTLGGRGKLAGNGNGGRVHIKCEEACYIIAIISLTPRISYSQGNEFYMTDIDSLDDMHKPPMDGIGFQDLIGERLAWWDTKITNGQLNSILYRSKVGKLPAWIEYMTAVDKCYGDFADDGGKAYMVLNRNYERTSTNKIGDATTYIDPTKYNYAFAYTALDSQNFWNATHFKIKARRLMSARLIPNV